MRTKPAPPLGQIRRRNFLGAGPHAALNLLVCAAKALDATRSDEAIARDLGVCDPAFYEWMLHGGIPNEESGALLATYFSGLGGALARAFANLRAETERVKAEAVAKAKRPRPRKRRRLARRRASPVVPFGYQPSAEAS